MKLCQFPQTMYIRLIGFAQMFTKLRFGEIWLVNHAQWWCGKPNETAPPCCKSEKASVHFLCEYLTINIGIQLEINEMFRRVCSMQIYTNRFQSLERRLQFFGWCENILFEFDESTTIVAVNSRRFGCCEHSLSSNVDENRSLICIRPEFCTSARNRDTSKLVLHIVGSQRRDSRKSRRPA